MGVLRLYLALAVLNAHYTFWDSRLFLFAFPAVCAFFIISGFYMSIVLHGKYGDRISVFYLNRLLRIYPVVVIVVALTVVGDYSGMLASVPGINAVENHFTGAPMPIGDRLMAIFNSIALFPAVLWRAIFGFGPSSASAITSVIAPQLYTVGIELCFYLIAPFLLVERGWRLAVIVASTAAYHFIPLILDASDRPYQYEWFPAVLIFFMLGRISYSLYLLLEKKTFPRWIGLLFLPAIVSYANFFWTPLAQHISSTPETFGFYALVCVAVPFLFSATKASKVDRFIGDLSYLAYACQFMVIAFVDGFSASATAKHEIAFAAVMLFSVVLLLCVDRPIDRVRQRIARSNDQPRLMRRAIFSRENDPA